MERAFLGSTANLMEIKNQYQINFSLKNT